MSVSGRLNGMYIWCEDSYKFLCKRFALMSKYIFLFKAEEYGAKIDAEMEKLSAMETEDNRE